VSDDRLRDLQRRYRESGDAADGAAWLRARLRAGELSPERLELAARAGDRAAAQAADLPSPPEDLEAFLAPIPAEIPMLKGMLAAVRAARSWRKGNLKAALDDSAAWLDDPQRESDDLEPHMGIIAGRTDSPSMAVMCVLTACCADGDFRRLACWRALVESEKLSDAATVREAFRAAVVACVL
jgi:hypothetical protein